jgi:hypothetical protein
MWWYSTYYINFPRDHLFKSILRCQTFFFSRSIFSYLVSNDSFKVQILFLMPCCHLFINVTSATCFDFIHCNINPSSTSETISIRFPSRDPTGILYEIFISSIREIFLIQLLNPHTINLILYGHESVGAAHIKSGTGQSQSSRRHLLSNGR